MKKIALSAILPLYILVFSFSVFSQPFSLVKDVNYGSLNLCLSPKPQPMNLTGVGNSLLFTTFEGIWKSDGTNAGTFLLKGITGIDKMLPINGASIFNANNSEAGASELWISDGTEAGTIVVKSWVSSSVSDLTRIDGVVYFKLSTSVNTYELWKTDGSAAGTILLQSFIYMDNLTRVGGNLFFTAAQSPVFRAMLWKSNGTSAGTVLVKDIYIGPGSLNFSDFFDANGVLYFAGNDGVNGKELWKSDGTAGGTIMVKDLEPGWQDCNIRNFTAINNQVYFFAYNSINGLAFWSSDGSEAGTSLVKDLDDNNSPDFLTNINGTLFFKGYDDVHGAELWTSDGTPLGTRLFKDIIPGPVSSNPNKLISLNGSIYFSAANEQIHVGDVIECFNTGGELWKTDGTEAGTTLIKDIYIGNGGTGGPDAYTFVNGQVFFKANNGLYGRELWKTDGTGSGTVMVKDIFTTPSSQPRQFTQMNDKVYFLARNSDSGPAFGRGTEVYQTDGTVSGTNQSTWLYTLGGGSPQELLVHDGALYMAGTDGTKRELYRSDGLGMYNGGVTKRVKEVLPSYQPSAERPVDPANLTKVNAHIFFTANNGFDGVELWKTDGSAAGTVMISDINDGINNSNPSNLVNVNGVLFFSADNGVNGIELWKSDGTATGTAMIKDINPGANSSLASSFKVINGIAYFAADDGIHGLELWRSDGTEAGTFLVKDVNAGPFPANLNYLTDVNGTLFFSADDGVNGSEPWKSDGTEAGTVLVKDIYTGPLGSNPAEFINTSGIVHFSADDGINGRELWRSNGTLTKTFILKDIRPGTDGSNPTALVAVGANIVFAANDGVHGNEVWLTNGFEQGTRLMAEIEPGPGSADPTEIFQYGSKLLVSATNAMVGSELWIADVPADSPLPLDLLEFRGIVVDADGELYWKTDNELNTFSFVVERSLNGRNYRAIGSVTAVSTPGVHYYQYIDPNINLLAVPDIYYRLRQTDLDGKFTYSNIVVLPVTDSKNFVLLYPNPVKDEINMTINITKKEKMQWQLVDNFGRKVRSGTYDLSPGSMAVSIDIRSLSSGMYLIQLNSSSMQRVLKVIKQ